MSIGPTQGIYHHQFDREEVKGDVDLLWGIHRDYYERKMGVWWRKLKKGYRSTWTIGDLYMNPYKRVRERGKAIADVLSLADNIKKNWFIAFDRTKRTYINVKFGGDRYNVDIDMPFVFRRR